MKFIFKSLLYFLVFIISFVILFPKDLAYNYFEHKVSEKNIVISKEIREEKFFSFNIKNAELFLDGLQSASIQKASFSTLLFKSNLEIKNITLSENFKKMLPSEIKSIKFLHSFLDVNKIYIKTRGDFGSFEGEVSLLEKKILGELKPSFLVKEEYKSILRQFKFEDGRYKYELRF